MKQLDHTVQNSKSFVVFKYSILKFNRSSPSNVFNCNNCNKGIRLITPHVVGMSHFESTSHFLLHCPTFNVE